MANTTVAYPSDQHNSWDTGISIPAGSYISSISFFCDAVYNESPTIPVTLYIGGTQLAVCQPGSHAGFGGSASGNITGSVITANYNFFSFRSTVTFTYTITSATTSRTITRKVSPAGAGSITTKRGGTNVSSAVKGDVITVAAQAAQGYVFKGWTTSPANLISGSSFTMPDQNVTVTGVFEKISTGKLSKTSMNGGETVALTISAGSSAFSHKYNLSFGTGMETGDVNVAAGKTSVNIAVPLNWSAQIPNATSKSGGTLTLKTYSGSRLIGTSTITGLTYKVPASAKPTIGTILKSIERTIGSKTYANIGNIYVQNHCGVRIQASASGAQGSTIVQMTVKIGSYSGSNYNKTVAAASVDFTSGLLTVSGTTTITVTATDSRGRTTTATTTITVTAYSAPSGSLNVWRCDVNGDADDMGTYGKYELTKRYSNIGSNTLTVTLTARSDSATNPANSGDLLPGNRKSFSQTSEYTVVLTLTDALESVTIRDKIPSARFILAFDSTGNKIGVMKFPNKAIPAGKERTFEISSDTQVYIGDDTLEGCIDKAKATGYDTSGSQSTANNTMTLMRTLEIPADGLYMIIRAIAWASDGTGMRGLYTKETGATRYQYVTQGAVENANTDQQLVTIERHTQGDTLSVYGIQTSGGSLTGYPFIQYVRLSD